MLLKLMQFNLQDFFLRLAYPLKPSDLVGLNEAEWQQLGAGEVPNKPLAKLFGVARAIVAEAPDVALLAEVGGREALQEFVRLFLEDRYEVLFAEGNSTRGIESAFLLRKCAALSGELRSHRDLPVDFLYPHEVDPVGLAPTAEFARGLPLEPPGRRRLSRDIPELRLYHVRHGEGRADRPFLVILLAHLKSGFDPDGIDPRGSARRAGEAQALRALLAATKRDVDPVPVVVAGDLNARAARAEVAPEMAWIYADTDLEDVLELAGVDRVDRISHITYYGLEGKASQYDYIFLPKSMHGMLAPGGGYVHRYRYAEDSIGVIQLPGSLRERRDLPSDHYPVICSVFFPLG